MLVRHEVRLGGEKRLQLELNVLNLFNQQRTANNRYHWDLEPGAVGGVTPDEFFRGIDTPALIQKQALREDPLFLMDGEFEASREIRLGIRFAF